MSIFAPARLLKCIFKHLDSNFAIWGCVGLQVPVLLELQRNGLHIERHIINYQYLWLAFTYKAAFESTTLSLFDCLKWIFQSIFFFDELVVNLAILILVYFAFCFALLWLIWCVTYAAVVAVVVDAHVQMRTLFLILNLFTKVVVLFINTYWLDFRVLVALDWYLLLGVLLRFLLSQAFFTFKFELWIFNWSLILVPAVWAEYYASGWLVWSAAVDFVNSKFLWRSCRVVAAFIGKCRRRQILLLLSAKIFKNERLQLISLVINNENVIAAYTQV